MTVRQTHVEMTILCVIISTRAFRLVATPSYTTPDGGRFFVDEAGDGRLVDAKPEPWNSPPFSTSILVPKDATEVMEYISKRIDGGRLGISLEDSKEKEEQRRMSTEQRGI